MKRLTLLRHAHADWPATSARDFDRPLDALGHKGAHIIAPLLAKAVKGVETVLVSPALRAMQTYTLLARAFALPAATSEPRLYMASRDTLLDVLHEQSEDVHHILVIGHNPGLQDTAAYLADDSNSARIAAHFPTSAFASFESAAHWQEWQAGSAKLLHYSWPRQIDPSLEADK